MLCTDQTVANSLRWDRGLTCRQHILQMPVQCIMPQATNSLACNMMYTYAWLQELICKLQILVLFKRCNLQVICTTNRGRHSHTHETKQQKATEKTKQSRLCACSNVTFVSLLRRCTQHTSLHGTRPWSAGSLRCAMIRKCNTPNTEPASQRRLPVSSKHRQGAAKCTSESLRNLQGCDDVAGACKAIMGHRSFTLLVHTATQHCRTTL